MAQQPSTPATYDYIVVGAGSAGAVVASRLSEDPTTSVLLLEAGPEAEALEISMPAAFPNLFKTRWDWDYTTTPQPGLGGQRAYWPRMKALGGEFARLMAWARLNVSLGARRVVGTGKRVYELSADERPCGPAMS